MEDFELIFHHRCDENDPLQLHNAHLYEDADVQSSYFNKFLSNPSIYGNSMVPSQNLKAEAAAHDKKPLNYSNIKSEDSEDYERERSEKGRPAAPRTPSPQPHGNPNVKLEVLNSFSDQRKTMGNPRDQTPREARGQRDYNNSASQESAPRGGGVMQEFVEPPSSAKAKKKVCCNCKKSRCLKLYCDCFGRGEPCSKECNCVNCYNNEEHQKERLEAISAIREKNPSAFKPKIDRTDSPEKVVRL